MKNKGHVNCRVWAAISLFLAGSCVIAGHPQSYEFNLARVEGRTVFFSGVDGSPWREVSYGSDESGFLVSKEGVRGPVTTAELVDVPAMIFLLTDSGDTLAVTCQARKCTVYSTPVSGKTKTSKLRRGRTTRVSTSSAVSFKVVE